MQHAINTNVYYVLQPVETGLFSAFVLVKPAKWRVIHVIYHPNSDSKFSFLQMEALLLAAAAAVESEPAAAGPTARRLLCHWPTVGMRAAVQIAEQLTVLCDLIQLCPGAFIRWGLSLPRCGVMNCRSLRPRWSRSDDHGGLWTCVWRRPHCNLDQRATRRMNPAHLVCFTGLYWGSVSLWATLVDVKQQLNRKRPVFYWLVLSTEWKKRDGALSSNRV